mgnify:CR=1 FL=1|jgi:hypothetical protein
MKLFTTSAAILASLSFASLAMAADAPTRVDGAQQTAQQAGLGGGASPTTLALTIGLVITGAAVIALGAWSGDSAETP